MSLKIPANIVKKIQTVSKREAEDEFKVIKQAIDDIYEERASNMNYQKIYDTAWRLVTHKHGEMLYEGVKKTIKHHTKGVCNEVSQQNDTTFLQFLLGQWEKFRKCASIIRDLLLYLDEQYVEKKSTHEKKLESVYDTGISIFKNDVLLKLTNRLQRLMLQIIQKERDGEEVSDRFLLKNLTQMMVEIDKDNVYIPVFEQKFLSESHIYYQAESQKYFDTSTAPQYLNKVKQRLKEESERAERCLDTDTKAKIEKVVREEMIEKYKELVIKKENSGVLIMLKDDKREELRLVFDVLGLVEGALKPTIDMLKDYVVNEGLTVVKNKDKDANPMELVNDIIDLRVKYDDLLLESFSKMVKNVSVRDKDFSNAIKEAFDNIVNTNTRFPEYLSLLLNEKLKKGKHQLEEKDQDAFFEKVILVFRHVREKDIFEKYYKNHLAKRLLSSRSASEDAEKFFISKLKAEFGYQFTSKFEGMFKDIKLSAQLNEEWKKHVSELQNKPPVDMTVQVLTHGCWPVTANARLELPDFVKASCDAFRDHYLKNHSGRKLTWQFNMGTADIKANGFDKPYEFNVSTYQLGILMCFNDVNEITFGELAEKTKIPVADLKKNLLALCLPVDKKTKDKKSATLLLRNPPKKEKREIDKDTKFSPNQEFKSKLTKVKILPVVVKETKAQQSETINSIKEERNWVLDAVIVRIMKMRKKLEHKQLVDEVVQQLQNRFLPSGELVKKRIESLIDREYLERNENDRKLYHYLA